MTATIERDDPIATLAANLTACKEASGLSYRKIERAVMEQLGEDTPTSETIRNYHEGNISMERLNMPLVIALARVYRRRISDLSPVIGRRVELLRTMLVPEVGDRRSNEDGGPDLREHGSGWIPSTAGHGPYAAAA